MSHTGRMIQDMQAMGLEPINANMAEYLRRKKAEEEAKKKIVEPTKELDRL